MLHFTAHSRPDDPLFRTWAEARALWRRLLDLGPPHALVLMPDHLHLLSAIVTEVALRKALFSYRRWRFETRRLQGLTPARGDILLPIPPPEAVPDRQHLSRVVRYIHLNPCRGRLVSDPLAWPFSTHRDRVGLAVPLACPPDPDPCRFHTWVSSDATVHPGGTRLPDPVRGEGQMTVDEVIRAVSAACRVPFTEVRARGPARRLVAGVLLALGQQAPGRIAKALDLQVSSVTRLSPQDPAVLAVVGRVLGDPRFAALDDGDLTRTEPWLRYARVAKDKRYKRTFDPPTG